MRAPGSPGAAGSGTGSPLPRLPVDSAPSRADAARLSSSPDYETIRNGGLIFAVVAFVLGLIIILSKYPGWAGCSPRFRSPVHSPCSLASLLARCQALAGCQGRGLPTLPHHARVGIACSRGCLGNFHRGKLPTESKLGRRPRKYLAFPCQR